MTTTPDGAGLYLGMARARLGPAAALLDPARGTVGACEENRLLRARQAPAFGRADLAIAELLRFLHRTRDDIQSVAVVTGDNRGDWPDEPRAVHVDGHRAHASYAFHSAGVTDAIVLVSEVHHPRGWTAWRFRQGQPPVSVGDALGAYPLARIYGQLAEALGFVPTRDEHLVEALARAGRDLQRGIADEIASTPDGLRVAPDFSDQIRQLVSPRAPDQLRMDVAASVQRRLGECLVELITRLRDAAGAETAALCITGGLFFNTYFTTLAASCGAFAHVHVPAHPGRNGTAIGAALEAGAAADMAQGPLGSAYLGPAYADGQIKEVLDNCKLSYDLLHEERLLDAVVDAIGRGRLVGWFHGRLEWGPRALGHRSVLADPQGPHTLENLNAFLKRRPAYRSYGVSVPLAVVHDWFDGPPASPFMQFEYRPRDPERFRTILPPGVERLRLHTVDDTEPRFLRLLNRWGDRTGMPVLVNTSFNGFHEPLVCSPRDAIRVFYGTGLDVAALESFVLRK
jgi:carbamoyltransferase